jgi:hypothetical protein
MGQRREGAGSPRRRSEGFVIASVDLKRFVIAGVDLSGATLDGLRVRDGRRSGCAR